MKTQLNINQEVEAKSINPKVEHYNNWDLMQTAHSMLD